MTEDDDLEQFAVRHGFNSEADLLDTLLALGTVIPDRGKLEAMGKSWYASIRQRTAMEFHYIEGYTQNRAAMLEDQRNVARIMKAACPSSSPP